MRTLRVGWDLEDLLRGWHGLVELSDDRGGQEGESRGGSCLGEHGGVDLGSWGEIELGRRAIDIGGRK